MGNRIEQKFMTSDNVELSDPQLADQAEWGHGAGEGSRATRQRFPMIVGGALAVALIGGGSAALMNKDVASSANVATLLSDTQAQQAAHVSVTVSGRGVTQTLDGHIDFASNRSSFVVTRGERMETRSIGADTWTSVMPGMFAPAGKKWMHLSRGQFGGQLGFSDPHEIHEGLVQAGGTAKALDDTDIAGRRVRHYRVTGLPGKAGLVFELYLDDDGLLRRLVEVGPLSNGKNLTFQLDVLAYTGPVKVEAPPADQVFESSEWGKNFDECSMMQASLVNSSMSAEQRQSLLASACSSSASGH